MTGPACRVPDCRAFDLLEDEIAATCHQDHLLPIFRFAIEASYWVSVEINKWNHFSGHGMKFTPKFLLVLNPFFLSNVQIQGQGVLPFTGQFFWLSGKWVFIEEI